MDVNTYVARIERAFEDEDELERIRSEAASDQGLSDEDKRLIDSRAGTYLADLEREQQGGEQPDPEAAPEEAV